MKVSVSPRRINRSVAKSIGVLFILALIALVYVITPLTAYAYFGRNSYGISSHK